MMAPYHWSERGLLAWLWWPASLIYYLLLRLRLAWRKPIRVSVPVICVGNNTAGGSGKTPTVIAICEWLQAQGHTPHIISRGYGGQVAGTVLVNPDRHSADEVGDEPLLLARGAPCWVSPRRLNAARAAIAEGASVLVMDDGLQNPTLHKDFSLMVVDGMAGLGNRMMIPAGPCREPLQRTLKASSAVLIIGEPTHPSLRHIRHPHLYHGALQPDSSVRLDGLNVHPFAGIGHPDKFFRTVEQLGGRITLCSRFPDHHRYTQRDLDRLQQEAATHQSQLVTTEKDAVRLPASFLPHVIAVPVTLQLSDRTGFTHQLLSAINPMPTPHV